MAIFKEGSEWIIEEGSYRKGGFPSRDAARNFNASRKAGQDVPDEPVKVPVKASAPPAPKTTAYNPNDLTVDRATDGKWFILTKEGRNILQSVKSRDAGRDLLRDLKESGKSFLASGTSEQATKQVAPEPTKPVEKPASTPVQKSQPQNDYVQPSYRDKSNDCPVYVQSTGSNAGPKPYKKKWHFRICGKQSSWRIYMNGVHIGTCQSKTDARQAIDWLQRTRGYHF